MSGYCAAFQAIIIIIKVIFPVQILRVTYTQKLYRISLQSHKTHTHTHTLSLCHTHAWTHIHTLSHTHTLSLPLSLTVTHTHEHTHTLSLSHTHTHSLSLSHTHTHSPKAKLEPLEGRQQQGSHFRKWRWKTLHSGRSAFGSLENNAVSIHLQVKMGDGMIKHSKIIHKYQKLLTDQNCTQISKTFNWLNEHQVRFSPVTL